MSGLVYAGRVALGALWLAPASVAPTLLAFTPVLLLTWLQYVQSLAVASARFPLSGRLQWRHELAAGVLSLALLVPFGLPGVIAGFGAAAALGLVTGLTALAPDLAWRPRVAVLWDLVRTGLPLTANGFLLTAMGTIDRWLLVYFAGPAALGIYGVANLGVSVLRILPVSVAQLLVVRFAEMAGLGRETAAVTAALDRATVAFAAGVPSGRLLLADLFFLSLSLPVTNWCLAVGRATPVLAFRRATSSTGKAGYRQAISKLLPRRMP